MLIPTLFIWDGIGKRPQIYQYFLNKKEDVSKESVSLSIESPISYSTSVFW